MAEVVFPASASWCESDGTVTSSERRVQRVRKALNPPGEARGDIDILTALSRALGHDIGCETPEKAWDELRALSPMHAGMSWQRIEDNDGLQWPCPTEDHPGTPFLHGRLWAEPVGGPLAPFHAVENDPPVDLLDELYPLRLTTGRRLESYNTGVQTNLYTSPLHRGETLDLHPADGARWDVREGEVVKVSSRRGSVRAPVRYDTALRPGLAFMTLHFPDQVDTNILTIDAWDPKSGTAEFKATAIRIDKE
jgi:formate dehydrogenase major subunit